MSDAQQPDERPGHYFVSAFDPDKGVRAGYFLLAGPWPDHAQALAQVETVRRYAERVDGSGKATWMAYGTCRAEVDDTRASRLGSDPAAWQLS